jgi:hypothetical protein
MRFIHIAAAVSAIAILVTLFPELSKRLTLLDSPSSPQLNIIRRAPSAASSEQSKQHPHRSAEMDGRSLDSTKHQDTSQSDHPTSKPPLHELQLATNFELPATLMPKELQTWEISEANKNITTQFYQNLARVSNGRPDQPSSSTQSDDVTIIEPNAATDHARKVANALYQSIFGDAACNAQLMNTKLEVQLPTQPAIE